MAEERPFYVSTLFARHSVCVLEIGDKFRKQFLDNHFSMYVSQGTDVLDRLAVTLT